MSDFKALARIFLPTLGATGARMRRVDENRPSEPVMALELVDDLHHAWRFQNGGTSGLGFDAIWPS
jgi:hypothetical protein